ncbi:hypothetical protein EC973_006835 [Apophysomyces ossiformis]|uniref:MIT domain-containing protein n=1 Tax=Apophysomyces ossiformis TaxID=679940 RepID=A0A8H7BYB5_9FUNG|nr:hypothetical protein EC973_006835 [Apophysomyces ossiformis]
MFGSKSNKRKSWTPEDQKRSSSPLFSHLSASASTPNVSRSSFNNAYPFIDPQPQLSRSSEYPGHASPPPYDTSPVPTPSTSGTFRSLNKFFEDPISIVNTTKERRKQTNNLDRRKITRGLQLVELAADAYEDGNDAVALDVYLSGVDMILMALPNKSDSKTKLALRDKLQSVEDRAGILQLPSSHQQKHLTAYEEQEPPKSTLFNLAVARITNTYKTTSHDQQSSPTPPVKAADPIYRFKSFGQFIIDCVVTFAVLIKQSPLPDLIYFIFGYLLQLLMWIDNQYHVVHKVQDFGFDCVKLMLQADEQYHLHEFASEAMYVFIAAGLKAAVAYKEAPGYQQQEPIRQHRDMPQIECYDRTPTRESRFAWRR